MTIGIHSKRALTIVFQMLVLVALLAPMPARADAITSLITAFMGSGLTGGGSGQFVNGDPANQVIPLLQQIYRQNADNGGVDNNGKRLQTRTSMQIADYQEQNQWERERRLRDDEIARSYPEMSNLSCAIASANQSAPLIDVSAANTTGQVVDLLSSGMYKSVFLATELSADSKAQIWCKLGSTGKNGTCDVDYDLLIKGAEEGHTKAITVKHSIPCDMPGVIQEFQQMKTPRSWTPNQRHKECVAAILSIANEFPVSNSLPTKEEASTVEGKKIWDRKINQIAIAAGAKGGIFEKFEDRVSTAESSASGCMRGIRAGGTDMYTLLQQSYGDATRGSGKAPFGLPPSGFCLSKLQFRMGQLLMEEYNKQQFGGRRNQHQLLQDIESVLIASHRTHNHAIEEQVGGINSSGLEDIDGGRADRAVRTSDNRHEELLGAIRLLTSEIQKMNKGLYADRIQEVSAKKGAKRPVPVIPSTVIEKSEVVSDALKEMGIKVSAPYPVGGALTPITQEFPVLPPQ